MPSTATLSQYFQYAFALRVSFLFWLFPPILCLLDLTRRRLPSLDNLDADSSRSNHTSGKR